ncbi:MAG TPA: metal-dependent hydrolase [Beijerinckiaceae bacterium]|nr:metal-dependent hydrolase [Beijerinckiaceae bacterium]
MKLTWYGHSAFALEAAGKKLLIDPFLTGNPSFVGPGDSAATASAYAAAIAGTSHVVVTHGHGDHVGDAADICIRTRPTLFCNYDLGVWLMGKVAAANGGQESGASFELMNTGGTVENGGVSVTLVRADHSSGMQEGEMAQALGMPNGAIVRLPGAPIVYHMGDTDIFSDMGLINEIWKPDVVIIPIGDRFTMGPRTAALAIRRYFPGVRAVVPCHWGTFGLLSGTPAMLKAELGDLAGRVVDLAPGGSVAL